MNRIKMIHFISLYMYRFYWTINVYLRPSVILCLVVVVAAVVGLIKYYALYLHLMAYRLCSLCYFLSTM